jgi:hypothetical protein
MLAHLQGITPTLPAAPLAGFAERAGMILALSEVQQATTSAPTRSGGMGAELIRRRLPMKLSAGNQKANAAFELRPNETAYRIVVRDQYGFVNAEPPHVVLLPEHFPSLPGEGLTPESEVEGKPIPVEAAGGKFRIGYHCQDQYGLTRAQLRYRIIRRGDPDNPEPWRRHRLDEIKIEGDPGPFDPRQGVFRSSGLDDQIEFYAEPSPNPALVMGRMEGGGRFDFQTGALGLGLGDQIEFYVEVFDNNPDGERALGRSDIRRKAVVTGEELTDWLLRKAEHENRVRDLERKQRDIPVGRVPAR